MADNIDLMAKGFVEDRETRQNVCVAWGLRAFGPEHVHSVPQRALRFFEECCELVQACGTDRETAHRLLDFVYNRPKGTVANELGGVGVTTMMLAASAGLSAELCELEEVLRVLSKDPAEFTKRNEEKNAAGFDAGAYRDKPY